MLVGVMATGCLLVAKHENMAMFSNTVVLLLEHSDKIGSVGIILNLPMPLLVRDVTDDTPAIKGDRMLHCYCCSMKAEAVRWSNVRVYY
jgi:putative AlgH/UPF0301 family transcriptional regulator